MSNVIIRVLCFVFCGIQIIILNDILPSSANKQSKLLYSIFVCLFLLLQWSQKESQSMCCQSMLAQSARVSTISIIFMFITEYHIIYSYSLSPDCIKILQFFYDFFLLLLLAFLSLLFVLLLSSALLCSYCQRLGLRCYL